MLVTSGIPAQVTDIITQDRNRREEQDLGQSDASSYSHEFEGSVGSLLEMSCLWIHCGHSDLMFRTEGWA